MFAMTAQPTVLTCRATTAKVSLRARRTQNTLHPPRAHRKQTTRSIRASSSRNDDTSSSSKASQPPSMSSSTSEATKNFNQVMAGVDAIAQRYDWLSAGLGALAGTSYGVYRGQPVGQALGITLCATVVALVLDEMIKENEQKNGGS